MIDKLIDRIIEKENPTVAGLDPRMEYLPESLIKKHCRDEMNLETATSAIWDFNKQIIDSIHDLIPAVKLQMAYYEMYGIPGLELFNRTALYAKSKGLVVVGDVKRNDIGSTAQAYSSAYIGVTHLLQDTAQAFPVDAITVNPYLGVDGIQPFLEDCRQYNKGIFVLVKTSNPSSGEFQDLITQEGPKIYERVGQKVHQWGENLIGNHGYSSVGAVVGATYPRQLKELREIMPKTYFLVPGYGAQGGKIEDILGCFDKEGLGAIINASRSIMCAYKNKRWKDQFSPEEFAMASRAEAVRMKEEIQEALERVVN
ncbi:MAG TPA: orotidine-5'-phosphate decarboxylase [Clostridia bacterium]|nr:orotidine-5'-phosphate decarboxylase [Clostridia bacterium]